MGILNFRDYVTKAFLWPLKWYERRDTLENKYDDDTTTITGGSSHSGFNEKVIRTACRKVGIPESDIFSDHQQTDVVGICVDLSSFCYGNILNEVLLNPTGCHFKHGPSVVPQDVIDAQNVSADYGTETSQLTVMENDTSMEKKQNDINEDVLPPEEVKTHDVFDMFEKNQKALDDCLNDESGVEPPKKRQKTSSSENEFKCHTVSAVLTDDLIERCAKQCAQQLFNYIGKDAIAFANYFTLHYDENTTTCKWYEQYKRRSHKEICVSKESRCKIFLETIRLVRARLVRETKNNLMYTLDQRVVSCDDTKWSSLSTLLNSDEFVNDVVSEKMQLVGCGPSSADIRRQRYLYGEGEWKCFYTIHDVERSTKESYGGGECGTRFRWYVFGHDSDIGLGVLLFSTDSTEISYVQPNRQKRDSNRQKKSVISWPQQQMTMVHNNINEYKALHFFALSLLGNDYIPRLVNASQVNITALGAEVDRMINTTDEYCRKQVKILSLLFAEGERGDKQEKKTTEDCLPTETLLQHHDERLDFSRSYAYVLTRLLLAVCGEQSKTSAGDGRVEMVLKTIQEDHDIVRQKRTDETKTIRCKPGGTMRSLSECMDAFASCSLWYATYCLFYRHMLPGATDDFRTRSEQDYNRLLLVPGLPLKNAFSYNERRLHQLVRFEIGHTIDVKNAIKTCIKNGGLAELVHMVVKNVYDVLTE